ncbi:hypothetical protein F2Q68_00009952 [Brassica cretica]|uniref:MADS-box domain-containing protein n=1 Tax=Brassica cretica TaxID=69181 RepID=A0A8S9L261_BRACR|nr:hypothetical protein F2Q68_00009952 [Brassica cretica]
MTRKKVKLAFIANDSSRKATYKKRKKGLMKKVNELSTLCGINACAIIYSPYDSNPEVWPSNSGVQRIISEFRTLPDMDQNKKMVDQETFSDHGHEIMDRRSWTGDIGQKIMDRKSWTGNHGQKIMDMKTKARKGATTAPAATIQQQQQFHQHVGLYEQPLNLNLNHSHEQQQQQWFMHMMNHPQKMSHATEQMGFPFMNDNHHQQQQQRQIPGVFSTTPTTIISSSINPSTSSNPTNNTWFC